LVVLRKGTAEVMPALVNYQEVQTGKN
jgi:hypothetical protein